MTSVGVQLPQGDPAGIPAHGERLHWAKTSSRKRFLLALVLLLSALYMARELKRGWVPSDEGTLSECAERVMRGELPHRDYHEGYTGVLSYLNAAAFRVFGTNLASMRYMLFLFFLAWVPAFYYTASKFVSAPLAGALTLLAVAWGPPTYAAALPSWYNLFFATFGLAALLRYIEVQTGRWLLLAGVCGGISVLFKLPGLYFVAGTLLFLVYREQLAPSAKPNDRREIWVYRGFVVASILLYEVLIFLLLRNLANSATYLYFWVPELAIGAAVVWHEIYASRNRSHRFQFLLCEVLLFAAGVAIPIALFLVPYLLTGSVGFLVRDIFTLSSQLIQQIGMKPPVRWFYQGLEVNAVLIVAVLLTRSKIAPKLWKQVLFGGGLFDTSGEHPNKKGWDIFELGQKSFWAVPTAVDWTVPVREDPEYADAIAAMLAFLAPGEKAAVTGASMISLAVESEEAKFYFIEQALEEAKHFDALRRLVGKITGKPLGEPSASIRLLYSFGVIDPDDVAFMMGSINIIGEHLANQIFHRICAPRPGRVNNG